jgi:YVTN family beta-propeller protein
MGGREMNWKWRKTAAIVSIVLVGAMFAMATPASAGTVSVGTSPYGVGVNPTTNTIYVSNYAGKSVSVIDGATDSKIKDITVGTHPYGVGVNPTTNKIYVANWTDDKVSVINGATNTWEKDITVGTNPYGVGVNPTTNKIYVANQGSGTVSVINGATDTVTGSPITVASQAVAVGVNPTTNKIYVTNTGKYVSVINGATDAWIKDITVGTNPYDIGVNPTTNKIYVANYSDNTVSVINGATDAVTGSPITVGTQPLGVGVNPTTNRIYVTNASDGNLSVINGQMDAVIGFPVTVGARPAGVGVNASTNKIYVANYNGNNVSVIYGLPITGDGVAWGANGSGQLGDGSGNDQHTPVRVSGLTGVVSVAGGWSHSLAVKGDGTVLACGLNTKGELGDNKAEIWIGTPVQVPGLTGVELVAAGGQHSLALKSDGTVWAWGENDHGQVGNGSATGNDEPTPVLVSGLTGVVAVAAGQFHSLAVKSDRTVWAWGADGTGADHLAPVQVSGLTGAVAVAAGWQHSLVLKNDRTVWAWGRGDSGQLGNNSTSDSTTPVQVQGPGGSGNLTDVVAVAGGGYHSLAVKSDGTAWAWGNDGNGQLGNNSTSNSSTPVQVKGPGGSGNLTGAAAVAAGRYHSLALEGDGTVRAWGGNDSGQLGDNTVNEIHTPVQVSSLTWAVSVAAGDTHSLGISSSNPVPTITSISPGSRTAGQPAFTLTVNGTHFVAASRVKWNTSTLTTTYVSSTKLTASVPASNIASAGTASITVFNPAPGGGTSNARTFAITMVNQDTGYQAEGSTNYGFDCYVTIENPNTSAVNCEITYMTDSGPKPGGSVNLPAKSQATINPRDTLGSADFSTKVVCKEGKLIAVDRTMSWTGVGAASPEAHSCIGVRSAAKTWYLAEGSSQWGFECWLLIQNPNTTAASCTITYMIEGGGPKTVTKTVPANSRKSFNMADDIGPKDASIKVESSVPVIPERAMYRNNRREGHDSIGTTSPASDFYLAEGTSAYGFTTYVLIQNPNSEATDVTVTYMTQSGPRPQTPFSMTPNSRKTIRVNDVLPNTDFSTRVHGSKPIIAERAMYWDNGTGEACHDSIGMDSAHTSCYLPDGQTSDGRETFTLVQNPNSVPVTVQVTYMTPTGTGNVVFTDTVKANSRKTYNMTDKGISGRAAIMVTSKTAGKPIIVERAMYWNNRGAGTDTIGGFSD